MLALTPVAALMFRFNNPDALLVAALVAAAYCLTRALEAARTRWLVAAGALIGFAFLAKMGQAFLVLPAFGLVYLLAAPTTLRRRISGLLAGFATMIVAGGWWVAIVALLPASSRPYIDGSPDNNIFNLIFGYNGFQRLFGGGGGPGGGGGGGSNFSGATGTLRLFNYLMGGQASWLLPAALIALAAGLWLTRRAPRTDRTRAALLLWGGWLLVTAAVFSYSSGVIHTYYTVALAPAIAALVAIGGVQLWRRRESLAARLTAAAAVAVTGGWSFALLDRTPDWQPWVRVLVAAATVIAVARPDRRAARWLASGVAPGSSRSRLSRSPCSVDRPRTRCRRSDHPQRLDPLGGTDGRRHRRRPGRPRRRPRHRRAHRRIRDRPEPLRPGRRPGNLGDPAAGRRRARAALCPRAARPPGRQLDPRARALPAASRRSVRRRRAARRWWRRERDGQQHARQGTGIGRVLLPLGGRDDGLDQRGDL